MQLYEWAILVLAIIDGVIVFWISVMDEKSINT